MCSRSGRRTASSSGVASTAGVSSSGLHAPGAASYLATKIPGAKHVLIEGAGHMSNLDAPAEFNAAVLAFLAGLK